MIDFGQEDYQNGVGSCLKLHVEEKRKTIVGLSEEAMH